MRSTESIEPEDTAHRSRPRVPAQWAIVALPVVLTAPYFLLLSIPLPREVTGASFWENQPQEVLTFAFLLAGGILGAYLASLAARRREGALVVAFFSVFSLGLIIVAMEEVSWGQQFFHLEAPEALRGMNRQGEVTLHNLGDLSGHMEYLRMFFGLGGLVGVALSRGDRWDRVTAPPVLLVWFLIIAFFGALDVLLQFSHPRGFYYWRVHQMSEVVEFLIGGAALIYVILHLRIRTGEGPLPQAPHPP